MTGSSNPINLDDFDVIISLTEGEVAGAAAEGGYSFPIPTTASVAYDYMRKVVADGAVYQVLTKFGGTLSPTAKEMKDAYIRALSQIRNGDMTLLGAVSLTEAEGGRQSVRGGGIASPVISATWFP